MTVFSITLMVVISALIVNFFRYSRKNNLKPGNIFNNVKSDLILGLLSSKNLNFKNKNLFNFARRFLYSLNIILLFFMALSGFLLPLFWQPTDGIFLFIHILLAPFFSISIFLAIALYANNLQFNSEDYEYLSGHTKLIEQKRAFWKKLNFWLFCIAVIFNIGSIVFAMYPAFGTTGQYWLLNIHRYSALVILIISANYLILKYTLKSD